MQASEIQKQKFQLLGQMTGGISHDFNNLLAIVEGYAQVLQHQLGHDPAIAEKIEAILLATKRGSGLIHRLMEFGQDKISANSAPVETVSCDLVKTILGNKVLLRPVLRSSIDLVLRLPDEPLYIGCDDNTITQLLIMLALQARESIRNTGTVMIEVSASHDIVSLVFSDNGTGVPAEKTAQLLQHFSSLAPVAQLVQQLKGTIDVRASVLPGSPQGAAFHLALPRLHLQQLSAGAPFAQTVQSLEDKTILIVDDEEALLPVLEHQLGRMGMKVLKAANADSALLIEENYQGTIDFLLTDVVMPGLDGVQLAEKLHDARPRMGVVYMTGYVGRSDILSLLTPLPPQALVVPKPLRPEALSLILQQALSHVDEA